MSARELIERVAEGESARSVISEAKAPMNTAILKKLAAAIDYGKDTKAVSRLQKMAAMGPLTAKPIDKKLRAAGWLEDYDDFKETGAYDFNHGYSKVLYAKDGRLNKVLWNELKTTTKKFGPF